MAMIEELKKDKDCIFCKIIAKEITAQIIYEDDLSLVIMDVNPINNGHVLILPKSHEDHLWDLSENTYIHLFKVARKISAALRVALNPKRVGLIVEGFEVPHAHIHLTPLNDGLEIERHGHHDNTKHIGEVADLISDALK